MFDEYEILEYILKKAHNKVRVPYKKIYEHFEVGSDDNDDDIPYENKKSVDNFLNVLEIADRIIVNDVMDKNIIPIYTIILYREKDKLPGVGFYDVFKTRNRKAYETIAGNMNIQKAFKNKDIKEKIFKMGMDAIINDLNTRFPSEDDIEEFILSAKIYRHQLNDPL